MPAITVVTFLDDDGDEFPIVLPGIFRANRGSDVEAAWALLHEAIANGNLSPHGDLVFSTLEYRGA